MDVGRRSMANGPNNPSTQLRTPPAGRWAQAVKRGRPQQGSPRPRAPRAAKLLGPGSSPDVAPAATGEEPNSPRRPIRVSNEGAVSILEHLEGRPVLKHCRISSRLDGEVGPETAAGRNPAAVTPSHKTGARGPPAPPGWPPGGPHRRLIAAQLEGTSYGGRSRNTVRFPREPYQP
jgi:hypothetical protein